MLLQRCPRTVRRNFSPTPAFVEHLEMRVLLSAGALDETFDGDGIATKYVQGRNITGAMSVRPDGKIVLIGTAITDAGFVPPDPEHVIVQYNADGSLDESFGDGGVATSDVPYFSQFAISTAISAFQSDGRILVGGQWSPSSSFDDFLVVRLNADGSRDSSFSSDGYATVNMLTRESVTGIAVASDGKIVVTGYTTLPTTDPQGRRTFAAFRLNVDGTLDTSFGDAGRVIIDEVTGTPNSIEIQADGKLVIRGGQFVVRLSADGQLDATFGDDGIIEVRSDVSMQALSVLPDGRLLIAGTTIDTLDFAAARLLSDGSVDASFGDAGWAIIGFEKDSFLYAMALQADGRIVLSGSVDTNLVNTSFGPFQNSDIAVVRLNSNGSLDTTFGESGRVQIPVLERQELGHHSVARAIAIQPDGRIVLAGDSLHNWAGLSVRATSPFVLARLLSGNEPTDFELIGRASNGDWRVSGFTDDGGDLQSRVFSHWAPSVDWKHVRTGDFDGDGLSDIAGWNPASGHWWVSLSDGEGATVKLAGHWSNATPWFDVAAVDLAAAGDRNTLGHFTHKSDLVGRDQWGNWWAAIANGDGTFSNVLLASWNAAANWSGTQFLDVNSDGQTDIISRTAGGAWWGLISSAPTMSGDFVYNSVLLATWVGNAGWLDVVTTEGLFGDDGPAVAARTSDGAWWALDFAPDGTATTRFVAKWHEAAGWRDVQAADLDGDGNNEIIGRTSTGGWWSLAFDESANGFSSQAIGDWNEAAGWHDVQTVSLDNRNAIIGRSDIGDWWLSEIVESSDDLTDRLIGNWNPNANWRDVQTGDFSQTPVELTTSAGEAVVTVHGNRRGTTVVAHNASRTNGDAGLETGLLISRTVAGQAREWFFAANTPTTISFDGHIGIDDFDNESEFDSLASGRAGDDVLDGRDNGAFDQLFGGDGFDNLLVDASDQRVQDGPVVMF